MGMNTHFVSIASPCLFHQLKAQFPITILQQGNLQADSSRLLSESRSHKMAWKSGCQFLHSMTQRRETCPGPIPLVVSTYWSLIFPFESSKSDWLIAHFHHLLIAILVIHGIPTKLLLFMAQPSSPNPRLQPLQECFQILAMPNISFQLVFF